MRTRLETLQPGLREGQSLRESEMQWEVTSLALYFYLNNHSYDLTEIHTLFAQKHLYQKGFIWKRCKTATTVILSYLYFPIIYHTSDTRDWYIGRETQYIGHVWRITDTLLLLLLEKSLQTQESHSGTVGRPNPGPGHPEKWSQNWTLAILLDQAYHQRVGARVQEEGGSGLSTTIHST